MKFAVEHFGLPALAPAALKDWYVRILEGKVVLQTDSAFFVNVAGLILEIYEGDFALKETADNKLNGWRHLALKVESLEAAKAELERRGVSFKEDVKPAGGGGRVLFFQDPEGNLLHLVERPANFAFTAPS